MNPPGKKQEEPRDVEIFSIVLNPPGKYINPPRMRIIILIIIE